jgi:hypothetical protein
VAARGFTEHVRAAHALREDDGGGGPTPVSAPPFPSFARAVVTEIHL